MKNSAGVLATAPARHAGTFSRSLTPIAYCLPIFVFGGLTAVEGAVPLACYPAVYAVKVVAVAATLLVWRAPLREIRLPSAPVVVGSLALGLAVFVLWVGVEGTLAYPHLGSRTAFNPFDHGGAGFVTAFLIVRFVGLVAVVPVMEEIFWRSFLLRYLTGADFTTLSLRAFSWSAFWVVVALSALSHPEWIVAAIANAVYSLWIRRTGSLSAVILTHASTNAALGLFIVATHAWQYW